MKLTLVLKQNREKSVQVPKEVSILGRSSECDIVVPDMSVSRKHCIITQKDGAVNIEDLGSTNHTNVPGKDLMEKGDGAIVKHGDTIKIGNIELIIQIDDQPLPDDDDAPIKLAEENPEIEAPTEEDLDEDLLDIEAEIDDDESASKKP